ncbi:hypothetical protein BX600DRAFT_466300 [Xylariales sp. PMI_506]|nr:hypothetical protein BX600DRAFT_466300 [Xylariales sp. PMI_506]
MELTADERVSRWEYPFTRKFAESFGITSDRGPDEDRFAIPLSSMPKDAGPQPLCGRCQGITMESLESDEGYQHYSDLEDLIRSAKDCAVCNLIQVQISAAVSSPNGRKRRNINARDALDLIAHKVVEQGLFMIKPTRIILKAEGHERDNGNCYIVIGTLLSAAIPNARLFAPIGKLILHDDSIDNIQPIKPRGTEQEILCRLRVWLRESESLVQQRTPQSQNVPLPRRVLDLGSVEDPGGASFLESDLRLLETSGQQAKYVTLSYSWGSYRDFRTLRDNYQDRLAGIRFKKLPPVFAQAVKITRGLGIRYLWIDALCIIQEDPEDWSHEAAQMSDIYWNSVCRLAVADSKSPEDPFFPPKENISVKIPHLKPLPQASGLEGLLGLPVPATEEEHLRVRELAEEFISAIKENPISVVMDENLGTRPALASVRSGDQPPESAVEHQRMPDKISRQGNYLKKFEQYESSDSGLSLDKGSNGTNSKDSPTGPLNWDNIRSNFDDQMQLRVVGDGDSKESKYLKTIEMVRNLAQNATGEMLRDGAQRGSNKTSQVYLTIPSSYSTDIDGGHLNSRGWVLQERLLAPRTIHFTSHHIYCEDSLDLCGDDWVRRYFSWMSCIHKKSNRTRIDLFPERDFNPSEETGNGNLTSGNWNTWRVFHQKPDEHYLVSPWRTVSAIYSSCELTHETDRLTAISGLIGKIRMDPAGKRANGRNFCGLWEQTLHIDLAWICRRGARLDYSAQLNLPSWAWISYKGPISFVEDPRPARDAGRLENLPEPEFTLVSAQTPHTGVPLPLATPAVLTLEITIRKIHGISTMITRYGTQKLSRTELAKTSPFDFDPRTNKMPVPLSTMANCQEVYNERRLLVGFATFDEAIQIVGDLFCAHISTLRDEATLEAEQELAKPDVEEVDLRTYQRPILAYALILTKIGENEYRRVGFAEVNYYWMTSGERTVVKLL